MRNAQSQYDPKKHPNLLFLKEIECGDENGIRMPHLFVRPYIYLNLSQLIKNHIPKLHYIEKLWLIFQILCGVCQLHTMKIVHGDIKTENILITSSN
jgi:serine/threonine protein kinase